MRTILVTGLFENALKYATVLYSTIGSDGALFPTGVLIHNADNKVIAFIMQDMEQ